MRKYDKNGDTRLDAGEWPADSKWGSFTDANRSGGTSIGVSELVTYLTDLSKRQPLSFDVDGSAPSSTPDPVKPKAKHMQTGKERLAAMTGLPDWFLRLRMLTDK